MTSRIRIFDHFMKPLAELNNIAVTPRSWVLNGYGRCEFSMSTSDPKCTEQILQYGNLVFIEHIPSVDEFGNIRGQLPDWVGIILTPRTWDFGVVHVTAYTAETILSFRRMPFVSIRDTPAGMFSKILQLAHSSARNIVIQPGQIDNQPITLSDNLRTNAYDHIKKLIKDSGMDWNISGNVNDLGNLELYANLYYRKGIDTPLNLTNTNTELSSPLLTEQGTITNQVFGYSQAQTDRGRFAREYNDLSSIDDYGALQINQTYMGRQDPTSVENAAASRIYRGGRPTYMLKRNALDYKDTFNYLDIGNTVLVKETSVGFNPNGGFGFDSKSRIISIDYNDLSNKSPLNLEVMEIFDQDEFSSSEVPNSAILWNDDSPILWNDDSFIEWNS